MQFSDEVLGAVGLTEMIVRPGDTSLAIGIGDLPIASPSQLINLMEHAAILSLDLYLEPGQTTIPVSTEFLSLSPYVIHHLMNSIVPETFSQRIQSFLLIPLFFLP